MLKGVVGDNDIGQRIRDGRDGGVDIDSDPGGVDSGTVADVDTHPLPTL